MLNTILELQSTWRTSEPAKPA